MIYPDVMAWDASRFSSPGVYECKHILQCTRHWKVLQYSTLCNIVKHLLQRIIEAKMTSDILTRAP